MSKTHTLDRIDNAKGYEPGNCRWATQREQCNNKTNNRRFSFAGRSQTIAQWAAEFGLEWGTLDGRLRRGWPINVALTAPVHGRS